MPMKLLIPTLNSVPKAHTAEETTSLVNEIWISTERKKKLIVHPEQKIDPEWIKYWPDVRPETLKLQENTSKAFHNLGLGKDCV